mgnify:FL=1
MKPPKLLTLPRGTAEGAVVLELEQGFTLAHVEQIGQARHRFPGLYGIAVDPGEDWARAEVTELYTQHGDEMMICTCAEFGSTLGWPEHELRLTIDATKLVREAGDDRALARELGSVLLPAVSDLVLDLDADQRPPSPSALTMLEAAIQPEFGYIYCPRDYAFRALLVQLVASTSQRWGVRWST